jgi:hypothetical protein
VTCWCVLRRHHGAFRELGSRTSTSTRPPILEAMQSQAWETPFVKLGSRSSTTTVLFWKWVPNFYCDPVPPSNDGAAAARGLCFLLVPQGLNSCSKPAGVFFGRIANTSESRAMGMPCMLSSWTCSLTLPGVDLSLVRLRPGMLASLRRGCETRWRDPRWHHGLFSIACY